MKSLLVAPSRVDHAHHRHKHPKHSQATVLSGAVGYRLAAAAAAAVLLWLMVGWALG